ncbi:MAG: U32 family peptidase [Patescibacteria group bacterium]
MNKIPEILAPAGDIEKLKTALEFGADAVYFGLPDFSLRARINKFDKEEIRQGAQICRKKNKKFYVTLNIYAHNKHIEELPKHLNFLKEIDPDGIILSDPGVLSLVKKYLPKTAIHISTQANVINKEAAKFWRDQGAQRIILARELTFSEITEIKKAVPELELEIFVHGAMCMAYSGRCILSKWMTGRSANLGDCAQPCRWKYHPLKETFVDDKNRFELKTEQDSSGTFIFNSYDINLIRHLNEISEAGVDSLKIEGRGKSAYYVGCAVRAYRKALDAVFNQSPEEAEKIVAQQDEELKKLSHRGYWTGFLLGEEPPHLIDQASKSSPFLYVGISLDRKDSSVRNVFVHNAVKINSEVEIITPEEIFAGKPLEIRDEKNEIVNSAHGGAGKIFEIKFDRKIKGPFLLRSF